MKMRSLRGSLPKRLGREAARHWGWTLAAAVTLLLASIGAWVVLHFIIRRRRESELLRKQEYLETLERHRRQVSEDLGSLQEHSDEDDANVAEKDVRHVEGELKATESVIAAFQTETDRLKKRLGDEAG